ncbi:cleavage and polyadenylation specificity factor, putative [Plasmodium ovale]|uniref:Cleavage and polyadenylation specificity factor, putative n=1 Tax=Plasmodium ovale TaxID=36330 RepID=A0A1C3KRM8_PLAOA|nr:cleavage and polyadenylation specificity factor, putative [Plasmodium ovale]
MNYCERTKIIIRVLGAGQTVGRSCVIVELANRRVMFDCGAHVGYKDVRKYPSFNLLVSDNVYERGEKKGAEEKGADKKGAEEKGAEEKGAEEKGADKKGANKKGADKKGADKKGAEEKGAEEKDAEEKDAEKKYAEEEKFYDNLNAEVNISVVNSSILDKEKLINDLKKINEIIDCVIISHFHMDHIGALPFFTEILKYNGPIIMSYPTKSLGPVLLLDSCKLADQKWEKKNFERQIKLLQEKSDDILKYNVYCLKKDPWNITEDNIYKCMNKVIGLQVNETYILGNLFITPYYAGHVLGACIYKLETTNFSVVYTGDYNTVPDKHLGSTKIPNLNPDIFISESTYATYVRPTRKSSELELCNLVHECVHKGGKVLIPVFAIGRAQELSILLDDYWGKMKINYPIYFGCGLTENVNKYYKIYSSWINSNCISIKRKSLFDYVNIFPFVHTYLNENRPMVLFATPGMLHTGLSLKAFKIWANNPQNLIVLPGYCVQGTIGNKLIMGERKIQVDGGTFINVLCKIIYLSFSAHADSNGIQQVIKQVMPKNIIFVHGEKKGMEKLSRHISKNFYINSICPSLGEKCTFDFTKYFINYVYIHHTLYKNIFRKITQKKRDISNFSSKKNISISSGSTLTLSPDNDKVSASFTAYAFCHCRNGNLLLLFFTKMALLAHLRMRFLPVGLSVQLNGHMNGHANGHANNRMNDRMNGHLNAEWGVLGREKTPLCQAKTDEKGSDCSASIFNGDVPSGRNPAQLGQDDPTAAPFAQLGKRKFTEVSGVWENGNMQGENCYVTNIWKVIKSETASAPVAAPAHSESRSAGKTNLPGKSSPDNEIHPSVTSHCNTSDTHVLAPETLIGMDKKGRKGRTGKTYEKAAEDKRDDSRDYRDCDDFKSKRKRYSCVEQHSGLSKEENTIVKEEDKMTLPLVNLRFKEKIVIEYQRFYNFVLTFFQEIVKAKNQKDIRFLGKSIIIKNVKRNDSYFFLLSILSLIAIHDGHTSLLIRWSYVDDIPGSIIRRFIDSIRTYASDQ